MHSGRACILPTLNQEDNFNGQEYLGMYPFIDYANSTDGKKEFWINSPKSKPIYISNHGWRGKNQNFINTFKAGSTIIRLLVIFMSILKKGCEFYGRYASLYC